LITTLVSGMGTPGGLAMINPYTAPASIVATNQALVDVTAGQTILLDQNLTISSTDASVTGATVSIGTGYVPSADALNFANQNGISGTYASGTLTLSGSATPAQYQAALQSITFSSTSSNIATRAVSYVVNDASDPGTSSSNSASLNIVVSPPLTITGAYVAGSSWTTPSSSPTNEQFDTYLVNHGLGDATVPTVGYALKTGASQTTDIPWVNINTISVSFSGPVSNIGQGSLQLVGGTGSGSVAAPSVVGFANDGNNTYSWTLSGSLGNNKYIFAIATTGSSFGTAGSTRVTDANGAGISGTFTTGSSTFPSGNGVAGSTFDFSFSVLPADGAQGGTVNSSDAAGAKARANDTTTSAAYSPYYDYYGAGLINSADAAVAAANSNKNQSSITFPTAPSARQVGPVQLVIAATGVTPLALGVQETGTSPATTSTVSTTSGSSTGTTPVVASSTSGTASGSNITTPTITSYLIAGRHGRHQYAAVDEALSNFDFVDALE
jgi:hypothetical protein